jgi:uncharacterized protein YbaP (TraB family)
MIPDKSNSIFSFHDFLYPKEKPILKADSVAHGVIFEFVLPANRYDDDLHSKKVTIIGLPNKGTEDEIMDLSAMLHWMKELKGYEEIITDDDWMFYPDALNFLLPVLEKSTLLEKENKEALMDKILEDPIAKQKFFELGQKIFERVKDKASDYYIEEPGIFFNEKVRLDLSNVNMEFMSERDRCRNYLNIINFIKESYSFKPHVGTFSMNLKDYAVKIVSEGSGNKIPIHHVLENFRKDILLSSVDKLNNKIDLTTFFENLNPLLSDESEKEQIEKMSAWKKAWIKGDVKSLKKVENEFSDFHYSDDQLAAIANKLLENINAQKSTLCLLPLNAVIGNRNIMDLLKPKKMVPVQLLRNVPENKKMIGVFYRIFSEDNVEVGHLLGTMHGADKKMLKLNPQIREAVDQATSVHFEIKFDEEQPVTDIQPMTTKDLEETDRLKLETFVDLLLKRLNVTDYENYDLDKKFALANHILEQMSLHMGEVVHFKPNFDMFSKGRPVGLEELLLNHPNVKNKGHFGLEENTKERRALPLEIIRSQFFSKQGIEKLPTDEKGIDAFITQKMSFVKEMFLAWKTADDDKLKGLINDIDPLLYEKLAGERDTIMAEKINEVLTSRKEGDLPFFAVGAAHLLGEGENVVRQLQKKGWKVIRR